MLVDATGKSHTYLLFKPAEFGIWASEHVEIATNLLYFISVHSPVYQLKVNSLYIIVIKLQFRKM